jgi:hypothetical protein
MNVILPYHNTPQYDDTSSPLREGNTASSSENPLVHHRGKNSLDAFFGPYLVFNDRGDQIGGGDGYIPIFRPQYQSSVKTHRYIRAFSYGGWNTLSTSDQVSYNDLIFGEYIHYMPNPRGGAGLVDVTPFELTTSVTMSRNTRSVVYSPYG